MCVVPDWMRVLVFKFAIISNKLVSYKIDILSSDFVWQSHVVSFKGNKLVWYKENL